MIVLNNCIAIDRGYKFEKFRISPLYNNQQDGRFFWINNLCQIDGIKGIFKVGLWFTDGTIRQIQLLYFGDDIKDESMRKEKHETVIKEELSKLNIQASKITNYWDNRDSYSTIVIDYC